MQNPRTWLRNADMNQLARDAKGAAALGICESLLIALIDLKIISDANVRDLLTDVMTANVEAGTLSRTPERNQAVVEIVERIIAGKNGLSH